jgi:uncharacterized protein YgiM (DUF1202 family)
LALATSAALAEDVWVKSDSVDIRAGKGAVYPVVVNVTKGTKLPVLAHEGHWLKVQVADKEGYVFDGAISASEVGGGGNLLANLGAGPSASDLQTANASKGLQPEAEDYSKTKNLNPALMQSLVDYRKSIDPKDWEAFTAEGKVGPYAP